MPATEAILVPVLNEEGAIGPFLAELAPHAAGRRVVLLDSGSGDRTVAEARCSARACGLHLDVLDCPPGLAQAIRFGVERVREQHVAVIDGDGQHRPNVLDALFEALHDGYDLAVGSRAVDGASVAGDWPRHRRAGSAAFLRIVRAAVRCHGVRDPLSGCFALRRHAWRQVAPRFDTGGYKFLLDFLAASRRLRVTERPLAFRARRSGDSKLAFAVFWELLVSIASGFLRAAVPRRWLSFGGVGVIGTATDSLFTGVVHGLLGAPFALGRIAGIVAANAQNYLLNNELTFADRRRRGYGAFLRGWGIFAASQSLGATMNWAVSVGVHALGVPWVPALILGVAVGAVVNYLAANTLVWRSKRM